MTGVRLAAIYIYPIKSARGVALNQSAVDDRGLRHDRRWMFVDDRGSFLSQRTLPRLAQIGVALDGDRLRVSAPELDPLELPLEPIEGELRQVTIWRDVCSALSAGRAAAQWATQALRMPASLVYMPDWTDRLVEAEFAVGRNRIAFTDDSPVLLTSVESLEDLNRRLDAPVPMNRFRPNLVVSGDRAYAEDDWKEIRIGDLRFHGSKSCARCVLITTDQATGQQGAEPLRTLAAYRVSQNKALFGRNLIPLSRGHLQIGAVLTADSA